MSWLGDEQIRSVTAAPATDAAAIRAVLWRIDNAGATREEAYAQLVTLGLVAVPVPVKPPRPVSAKAQAARFRPRGAESAENGQGLPGGPETPARRPTAPHSTSNDPYRSNGGSR